MAITIDWGTKVISVPKADMVLVQSVPVEIREIDVNDLRLILADLQDSDAGMVYPTIFNHNQPVSVGGVTLARVMELINGYTLTFEDGQYAVNIVGGNSNVGDNVNVNQVSVRSANSAGLVQTEEIEIASFGGAITYDEVDGVAGQSFPVGTPQRPVNNLADAKFIQQRRGIPKVLNLVGDLDASAGDSLDGWLIVGTSSENHVHLQAGSFFNNCRYETVHLEGDLYGETQAHDCVIGDTTGVAGEFMECGFTNSTVVVQSLSELHIVDNSHSRVIGTGTCTIDCNGDGDVGIRGYIGGITLANKTTGNASMDWTSGGITLDSSCTGGTIVVRGTATLNDNSNGSTVITTGLINDALEHASFNNEVTVDVANGSIGTTYPLGTGRAPVSDINDAIAIANSRGFDTIRIKGDYTFLATDDVAGFHIYGDGATLNVQNTAIVLADGTLTSNTHWHGCLITGKQRGESFYHDCMIQGLWNAHCTYERCGLLTPDGGQGQTFTIQQGTFAGADHTTWLVDCYSDEGVAIIDRSSVEESQRYSNWSGNIKFVNQDNVSVGPIWIHMAGGSVEIDSTCTTGIFYITGDGEIINNSGGSVVKTGVLQKIDDARIAIESTRPTHQGFGKTIYVDPVGGNDVNEGESQVTPVATFSRAHDLATDGGNDVIQFMNPSSAGHTHRENITITKNNVHLRSTSRDITFKSANDKGANPDNCVICVGDATGTNGYGCSITGLLVDGDRNADGTAGNERADFGIRVHGKFCALNYVWVKQATKDCIIFHGGDYHTILDGEIEKADRHGVSTEDLDLPSGSPREISIFGRTNIYLNDGDGVHLGADVGELGSTTRIIRVISAEIATNGGYGIHADADVSGLTIGNNVVVHNNNGGHDAVQMNILSEVHNDREEHHHEQAAAVWDTSTADHKTAGTFGAELATKSDIKASASTVDYTSVTGTMVAGTVGTGAYTDTFVRDNNYWVIGEDATTGLTVDFEFNIQDDHKPGLFTVYGRYDGGASSHHMHLLAWNVENSTWEMLQDVFMPKQKITDEEYAYEYSERHVDHDNANLVKIRLQHDPNTTFNVAHNLYLDAVRLSSIDIITALDIAKATHEYSGKRIIDVIESQRGRHTVQGNTYYVAPTNGVDALTNGTREAPCQSIQYVHDNFVTSANHDMIYVLADAGNGVTTLDEQVTLSKNYIMVRGPGTDVLWTSTSVGDVITVTGDGVEISGFEGATHTTGTGRFIYANNVNALKLKRLSINYSRLAAIVINGGFFHEVSENTIHKTGIGGGSNSIELNGLTNLIEHAKICNNDIASSTGDGIALVGTNIEDCIVHHNVINGCSGHGINIGAGVDRTAVHHNTIGNNSLSDINDGGTDTILHGNEDPTVGGVVANEIAEAVWDFAKVSSNVVGSMGELVVLLEKWNKNKTYIDATAKTLTVYDDDGVSALQVYDLKDRNGTASITEIFERDPV